jgi:hypothetical protein
MIAAFGFEKHEQMLWYVWMTAEIWPQKIVLPQNKKIPLTRLQDYGTRILIIQG